MTVDQQENITNAIADTVRRLSFLQYLLMQKTGDFGSAGRERAIAGFCRHLLGIPTSENLEGTHYTEFYKKIEEATTEWDGKSTEEIRHQIEETGFTLSDKFFRKHEDPSINEALELASSAHRIFIGMLDEKYHLIVFGPGKVKRIGNFKVIMIDKEDARTPSAILPMVAAHGKENQILLRREAFEVIFTEKWRNEADSSLSSYSSEVEIREKVRKLTLDRYNKPKKLPIDKLEKLMVDEMLETTAVHETAHGAFTESYADKSLLALGKILYTMPYSFIIQALDEILAEWMPRQGEYQGAIPYIASLAKGKNKTRAERLLFRYISDSWFLGNWDQAYLADLTDLFISSLLPYIKNPKDIHFSQMEQDTAKTHKFFLDWWENILKGCVHIFQEAQYETRGFTLDFDTIANAQHQEFSKQSDKYKRGTLMYERYFWTNMLRYLEKTAPGDFTKLKNHFQKAREDISKDLLAKITNRAEPNMYLREWLLQEAKARITF